MKIWPDFFVENEFAVKQILEQTDFHLYEEVTLPRDIAQSMLSPCAIEQAGHDGDSDLLVWSDEYGKGLVEYDLIKYRLLPRTREQAIQDKLKDRMREIERKYRSYYPQYFGKHIPPKSAPMGEITYCEAIESGLYLIYTCGKWGIAIACDNAEATFINPLLWCIGERNGDYMFYFEDAFAMAVYHIYETNELFDVYLISEDALVSYLNRHCALLVKMYNLCERNRYHELCQNSTCFASGELFGDKKRSYAGVPAIVMEKEEPFFIFPDIPEDENDVQQTGI